MSPKLRLFLVACGLVAVADQLSKAWIVSYVHPLEPIQVIEGFFRITHARNPGAALGLFQGTPVVVFILLTALAIGLVASFYRRVDSGDRLSVVALGLILGGAIGNAIDRLVRGEVVDFLQFDLGLFIFPDFNVADSAIVIGISLLLRDLVLPQTRAAPMGDEEA